MSFMHGPDKRIILIGILIITIITAYIGITIINSQKNISSRPVPLYKFVKPVSLKEFLNDTMNLFRKHNSILMLPTWMPDNLKPVAVWYKKSPFIAVVAYDSQQVKNYVEAKAGIEISFMSFTPNNETLQSKIQHLKEAGRNATVIYIDSNPIKIIWNLNGYNVAYIYDKKNNIQYTLGIKTEINITINDLIKIIKSMKAIMNNS